MLVRPPDSFPGEYIRLRWSDRAAKQVLLSLDTRKEALWTELISWRYLRNPAFTPRM
jgi:hypothetical protein